MAKLKLETTKNRFGTFNKYIGSDGDDSYVTLGSFITQTTTSSAYANYFLFGKGNDSFSPFSHVEVKGYGATSRIDLGEGDDTFAIFGSLKSSNWGINIIQTGSGNDEIHVRNIEGTGWGSQNSLSFGEGTTDVYIKGVMEATDAATNMFVDTATYTSIGWMDAEDGGWNAVSSEVLDIAGDVFAAGRHSSVSSKTATNNISKFHQLTINGDMAVCEGGSNWIDGSGEGYSSTVFIGGDMVSYRDGGGNHISTSKATDFSATIAGKMLVEAGTGANNIRTWGDDISINVESGMVAKQGSNNVAMGVRGVGDMDINVSGGVYSEQGGTNSFEFRGASNSVDITGGMTAKTVGGEGATNKIVCHDIGNTFDINISGKIDADAGSHNIIYKGNGSEHITLDGPVGVGGLEIKETSYNYSDSDSLYLKAASAAQFNTNYKAWLTDVANNGELGNTAGGSTLQLDVNLTYNSDYQLGQLNWLDGIIDAYNNSVSYNKIGVELQGNSYSKLNLGDLFSDRYDDLFSSVDLTGGKANTFAVQGSLSDNGMDGNEFTIHGDRSDTVLLSSDWTQVGTGQYANGDDMLLLDSYIKVVTG